jgi:hypothetical protein
MADIRQGTQDKLFAYLPVVMRAHLGKHEKLLLFFYAYAYNWTKNSPSYYSQESITRYLDISPKTYQDARRSLNSLGWISVRRESQVGFERTKVYVQLLVGRDDPLITGKRKGRNPKEAQGFLNAVSTLKKHHPDFVVGPKFKKLVYPAQKQSLEFKNPSKGGKKYRLTMNDL